MYRRNKNCLIKTNDESNSDSPLLLLLQFINFLRADYAIGGVIVGDGFGSDGFAGVGVGSVGFVGFTGVGVGSVGFTVVGGSTGESVGLGIAVGATEGDTVGIIFGEVFALGVGVCNAKFPSLSLETVAAKIPDKRNNVAQTAKIVFLIIRTSLGQNKFRIGAMTIFAIAVPPADKLTKTV